jgi:hypothetical protein
LLKWANANLGKASNGNPAAGSMPHLLAGRLAMLGDFQITNVPFAGSGPAIAQVMGSQLAGMSSSLGDWVQHHKGSKIRILATSGHELGLPAHRTDPAHTAAAGVVAVGPDQHGAHWRHGSALGQLVGKQLRKVGRHVA